MTAFGITQVRVINSEWIKFRSLRSTWWSVAAALLISVGLGILFSALHGNDLAKHHALIRGPEGPAFTDGAGFSLRGFMLAQLPIGVLGVLFVTGEYSTGMIRATLSAVPKRMPVWAAKAIVFAGVLFAIALAAAFVAFLGGQAALSGHPVHYGVSISDPESLRAVLGAAYYVVIIGLMGVGFGWAVRNTGGAIASLFGVILVLPLLVQALPNDWQPHVMKALPLMAGQSLIETGGDGGGSDHLSPGPAVILLAVYALVVLGAGLVVLRRKDA